MANNTITVIIKYCERIAEDIIKTKEIINHLKVSHQN